MSTNPTPTTPAPQFSFVKIGELEPSKNNPRKNFDAGKMSELTASVKAQGILQPILVRPIGPGKNQIVAGERRFRAAKDAGLETVPCIVQVMSDTQAEEAQNVENLQRADLTAMEEAASYGRLLQLKDAKGAALYTVEKLASRFGVSRHSIDRRLLLLKLPRAAAEALEDGVIGAAVCSLIGRIPDMKAREELAKRVIKGDNGDYRYGAKGALNFAEAQELITKHYMVGLAGAPFALDDAKLSPTAGACSACPKMTDNCAHLFDESEQADFKKKKVCCDPGCYRSKLANLSAAQAVKAKEDGKILLSDDDSEKVFPSHSGGRMSYNSAYVELSKQPDEQLLREGLKSRPSWKTLVEQAEKKTGQKVPRVMVKDPSGVLRECVEARLAVVCIEESGEKIFAARKDRGYSDAPGSKVMTEADKRARKALLAKNKANREAVSSTLANAIDRLKGLKTIDVPALLVVIQVALASHYSMASDIDDVAVALGIKLPGSFNDDDLSELAKCKPEDMLRLAAACIATANAADATGNAQEPPESLVLLAGKHKAPAPSNVVLAERAGVKVDDFAFIACRLQIELRPEDISKTFEGVPLRSVNKVNNLLKELSEAHRAEVNARVKGADMKPKQGAAELDKKGALGVKADAGSKALAAVKASMPKPAAKAGKGGTKK